jgi:hypothetical protein
MVEKREIRVEVLEIVVLEQFSPFLGRFCTGVLKINVFKARNFNPILGFI